MTVTVSMSVKGQAAVILAAILVSVHQTWARD